jgi:peptidoglycan hydrolase CwlO-like protein
MPMEAKDLFFILGAILTVVGSWGAAKISGRSAQKVKELDVDAQAYLNAQVITDGLINNLRTELGRAQTQISELHETITNERNQKAKLEQQLHSLQQTVDRMNERLREAGLQPLTTYHHHEGPGTGPIPLPPTS